MNQYMMILMLIQLSYDRVIIPSIYICFTIPMYISKVPAILHTPLMSGANAISGITIVGSLLSAGKGGNEKVTIILGTTAVAFATINVVGGYLVTDRMLEMFKKKGGDKK